MKSGKKSTASKLLHSSLREAAAKLSISESTLIRGVLKNVKPSIDARRKKVGRFSYIIPYAITEIQSINLGIKLIVRSARERRERDFSSRLRHEFIDSYQNKGISIKKKNEIYRLAEANKSLAFYR
jgi:small subunit ribosomal protein S7